MSKVLKKIKLNLPKTAEEAKSLLTSDDLTSLRLGAHILERASDYEQTRGSNAENKAFGILQATGVGVATVAALITFLNDSEMQSKISFLLPLFAVGATLLAKMIWRAFQVVKPGTFIVQTPYNYLNIQNHTEVEGLKCYLQTLITAYAHNLEVNSSKQYQYHCCLIDAKLLLWCTYLGALLLMGSKFFQWNFSLSFHWILIALFCTFAVFADCIKTHWTNFWTHHDSQLKES